MKRALSVQDPTLWQSAKPRSPAGLDERFASAFVGPPQSPGNAPQRSGTEGGEERAGVAKVLHRARPLRTTRPGTRSSSMTCSEEIG
jgi:hypothetical protein